MPNPRRRPEPFLEPRQPLGAERDFRQQYQHLAAVLQGFGDGLEIDFRLARPGDAFEKNDPEAASFSPFLQFLRRPGLVRRQVGTRLLPVGAGLEDGGAVWQLDGDDCPGVGQPADDPGPGAGLKRQFRHRPGRAFGQDLQHPFPGLGHPEPLGLGVERIGAHWFRRVQGVGHAHRHFQHRAWGAEGIARHPVDEPAADLGHRRAVEPGEDVLHFRLGDAALAFSPDDAGRLAGAQGNGNEIPVGQGRIVGHPVIVGSAQGQRQKDADALPRKMVGSFGRGRCGGGGHGRRLWVPGGFLIEIRFLGYNRRFADSREASGDHGTQNRQTCRR